MTEEETKLFERMIRRSNLFGKLTFGQVMDKLEKQHDALTCLMNDPDVPPYIQLIASTALD